MTRTVWCGTSWKMNKTLSEAVSFVDQLVEAGVPSGVQAFVLPAHTALATVRDALPEDSPVLVGAQNAHWRPEGAGTGEVSMRMVADAGATLVEIGHSERREHFGETDEIVAAKVEAAVRQGLTPLVCVGEPAAVRASGEAEGFVSDQVRAALSGLDAADVEDTILAYEPVWAIGEDGTPATPDQVGPVLAAISTVVAELSDGGSARALLYGGGVDAANTADFLADPHVDGLFVGRAAWSAPDFIALLQLCAPP